jgi:uncharacterized membrane protein
MLFKLPLATTYYLTLSWCGLAVAHFVLAVTFKERVYRFCGLAVLGLAFLRAGAIDAWQLEPIPRIMAFGGLGVIAMALSFGYWHVFGRSRPSHADDRQA